MPWYLMGAAVLVTCYILPKSFYIKGVYKKNHSSVDFKIPTKLLEKYIYEIFNILFLQNYLYNV